MRYIFLYLIFFFFSFITSLNAKISDTLSLEYPSINYTTKDGLPSNETFCVFEDSRGYIWIGTDRGLVKYDGYEFKTYTTLDGLTDNVILALNEDDKGNIWYSGLNKVQLGYIDPQMRFHEYEFHQDIIQVIDSLKYASIHFNEIHIDGDIIYLINNKYGYIVLNNKGIQTINIEENSKKISPELKLFNSGDKHFIYSNKINYYDDNFNVEVYNYNGEAVYNYKVKKYRFINSTLLHEDSSTYIYNGNNLLILNNNKVTNHKRLPYICSAFQLSENQFLYSTYNEKDNNYLVYYSNSPEINSSKMKIKEGVRVTNAIKDSHGGIWMTTLRRGLVYISNFNSKITTSHIPIEVIYKIDDELILASRDETYLYKKGSNKVIRSDFSMNYLDFDKCQNQYTFVGFLHIDLKLREIGKVINEQDIKGIQTISETLQYAWCPGYLYKIKNDTIYHDAIWDNYQNKLPFQGSLFCFKEDSCVYGTRNGLFLYLGDSIVNLDKGENNNIRQVDFFRKNEILVYSVLGEGLVLRYHDGKEIRLTRKEGLVSNTINSIFMDSSEVLWIGTNKGVNSLSINDSNQFDISTVISSSRSLNSPNILQIYCEDSILYLGTDAGFNIIDLKETIEKIGSQPLFIDNILVNGKPYNHFKEEIILPYDSNSVEVNYIAIAFNMYGEINYRYRLDGFSKDWIYTKELRSIFSQINPGSYTFYLEVQNEFGDWNGIPINPRFIINKAYWSTWWFRGIMIILFFMVVGGALYYYILNLKKEKSLTEDKQLLSEELNESRQKALSAQLNPHFVFNSLNSIQNFILTKRTELSSDYLGMFSKLMRFVFENSKKLYVPLSDEIEALRLYLELEQVRHNHKFVCYIKQDKDINIDQVFIPSLLVQPLIENAIWHGLLHKLSGERILEVEFTSDKDNLHIIVKDNGVGRGKVNPRPKLIRKQKSSGVELTKQRLDLLSQSTGLKTNFEVIDLIDNNQKPCGTMVKISIPNLLNK